MRKRFAIAIPATILMLGCGAFGVADGSSAATPTATHTLYFQASYVNGTQQDAPPAGDSIGDRALDLFHLKTRGGRDAGDSTSECVLIRASAVHPLAQCAATLVLTDGTLELAGVTTSSPDTIYAIVGGTGRYVASRGTVRFAPRRSSVAVTATLTA